MSYLQLQHPTSEPDGFRNVTNFTHFSSARVAVKQLGVADFGDQTPPWQA